MATYCKNHVDEEVEKLSKNAKGEIERIPTKEGMCGHLGGCTTAHDNLYELKYDYQPSKEAKQAATEATEKEAEASSKEGTTAEEKPTEEAPTTS